MSNNQKNSHVPYVPAELREVKVWYIVYYVTNPQTNKLQIVREKVNRIRKITEQRKHAKEIVRQINIKLSNGWNPLIEAESRNGYHKLKKVADSYIKIKERELRPDSMRSYRSFINELKEDILNCYYFYNHKMISSYSLSFQ